MEHTKGELKIEECFGQTEETPCCYIKIDGIVYFQTLCGNDKANAERLVKCWNYHEDIGFGTHEELINRCAELGGERDIALGEFALIKKQRDALLAVCGTALKGYQHICHCCGSTLPKPCSCKWEPLKTMLEQAIAGEK